MRMFPIMGILRVVEAQCLQRNGFTGPLLEIPWAMIEPHVAQARTNHALSLEQLEKRGGISALEALAIITDKSYAVLTRIVGMNEVEAHMRLHVMVLEWKATQLL